MSNEKPQQQKILENLDPEQLKECLKIAMDNRAFEIDLLWRRTLVFWGFVALLFGVVALSEPSRPYLSIVLSAMGGLLKE